MQSKIPDSIRANTKGIFWKSLADEYSIFRHSQDDEKIGQWLNKQASLADYSIKQGVNLFITGWTYL